MEMAPIPIGKTESIKAMKNVSRNFILGMLMICGSGFSAPLQKIWSNNSLLEGTEFSKQYLVQLSGTVMNETFPGLRRC